MKKILCLFSGGMDSTYLLHELLTNDKFHEYQIHAHHLSLIHHRARASAERQWVKAALAYFREHDYRQFLFTESAHDFGFLKQYYRHDLELMGYVAANICHIDRAIQHVAIGRTRSDIQNATDELWQHINRGQGVFQGFWTGDNRQHVPNFVFPIISLNKPMIAQRLPAELRDRVGSCRQPVLQPNGGHQPCGRCDNCQALADAA